METKGIKLTEEILDAALYGGTILGGGGGGDAKKAANSKACGRVCRSPELLSAEDLDDNDMVLTASLVGAPNAENQFMTPADLVKPLFFFRETVIFLLPGSLPMNRAEKQR